MKNTIIALFLTLSTAQAATSLFIPISGDSHKTIAELNASLQQQGSSEFLPEVIEITAAMSQEDIRDLLGQLGDLADKASKYQGIETQGAYGIAIEGKKACFRGNIMGMRSIYENMIDSFLSEQFYVMAVSTSRPNSFGIKYDESDSGSDGSWINISRCN
jgi:hypothetical protein